MDVLIVMLVGLMIVLVVTIIRGWKKPTNKIPDHMKHRRIRRR